MEMRRERYLTVVECFAPGDIFDEDQIKRESVVGNGCLELKLEYKSLIIALI